MQISGSASLTAINAMNQGFSRLAENAQTIANPNSDNDQTVNSLINNKMTQTDIEAMVKVLKTEDQLIGQLLDIKA